MRVAAVAITVARFGESAYLPILETIGQMRWVS